MANKKENYQETTLSSSKEAQGSKPNPLVQLDPGLFIWTILTFLLLCFALAKFAWKPLLKALESRENDIQASIEDAEKAKSELENLNQEAEKIIADFNKPNIIDHKTIQNINNLGKKILNETYSELKTINML